ncbi:MAG: metallophosphoesterase [Planctomycetota bacterium]
MTIPGPNLLKIGLVTDIHYADTPANEKRDTRASLHRVRQAVNAFQKHDVDVVVCLGDLIHSGPDIEAERSYMQTIVAELRQVNRPIYFCLGNHCVDRLAKPEVLEIVGQPTATFDATHQGIRLMGLDTCFNPDGSPYGRLNSDWRVAVLPTEQMAQLVGSISERATPTILFCHHRLDAFDDWSLRNAQQLCHSINPHRQVFLVLQGHAHINEVCEIAGRTHITLEPMVGCSAAHNAYSILTIESPQNYRLQGFVSQPSYSHRHEP